MSLPREFTFAEDGVTDVSASLLSVQSAPIAQRERPSILRLDLPLANVSSPADQEEESLLTLSSLTGRPLLAAREHLRNRRASDTAALDGGYGWVVVFGAFLVQFCVAGLCKSSGILYMELPSAFDASHAAVSWIPAVLSTLCLALAPLSAALSCRFSCRRVVFAGGVCCAGGLALSYCARSLPHLVLSFGLLTGIGGGLSTTPGIVIISEYFDKRRALANGICVSGSAAGSFVFPFLIEKLLDVYGLHGTFLFLGGVVLHVCVAAMLYRAPPELVPTIPSPPLEKAAPPVQRLQSLFRPESDLSLDHLKDYSRSKRTDPLSDIVHPSLIEVPRLTCDSEDSERLDILGTVGLPLARPRLRPSTLLHSAEDLSTHTAALAPRRHRSLRLRPKPSPLPDGYASPVLTKESLVPKQSQSEGDAGREKGGCCAQVTKYVDLSLLRDGEFRSLAASALLMSCAAPHALYYLPAHASAHGVNAGRLMAISAVLDLFGRLGLGWMADLNLFSRTKAYIVCVVTAGCSLLWLPHLSSPWALGVAAGAMGLSTGGWFLLVPVRVGACFRGRSSSALALVRLAQALPAAAVPPLAGWLRDASGGYAWCFGGMGAAALLAALPAALLGPRRPDD